jgi:hypothetical protein
MATGRLVLVAPFPVADISFDVETPPAHTYPLVFTETQIPGGNTSFLDIGGQGGTHTTLKLFVPESEMPKFKPSQGYPATLTYYKGTVAAILLTYSEGEFKFATYFTGGPPPVVTNSLAFEVNAEFLLL